MLAPFTLLYVANRKNTQGRCQFYAYLTLIQSRGFQFTNAHLMNKSSWWNTHTDTYEQWNGKATVDDDLVDLFLIAHVQWR